MLYCNEINNENNQFFYWDYYRAHSSTVMTTPSGSIFQSPAFDSGEELDEDFPYDLQDQ